jgi:hypothetical protein
MPVFLSVDFRLRNKGGDASRFDTGSGPRFLRIAPARLSHQLMQREPIAEAFLVATLF